MDEMTLVLNKEQWDAITDIDFEHTNEIIFHTTHGKEVKFVKPSAQPTQPNDSNTLSASANTLDALDCVSRQAVRGWLVNNWDGRTKTLFGDWIENLPSVQPTLYGYKIEHLAYIARVMIKEGVTADYAVRTFDDISRALRMIIEEAQQKVEEALNG